jgi:hypothetical protein
MEQQFCQRSQAVVGSSNGQANRAPSAIGTTAFRAGKNDGSLLLVQSDPRR